MRNILAKIGQVSVLAATLALSACNDFLNDIPKGEKTPSTWEDFNGFLKNEYIYNSEMGQAYLLLNDVYRGPTDLNTPIIQANYNWDETIDRSVENTKDYYLYTNNYQAIFNCNLIIEQAPTATKCTEAQRAMLIAQARTLRVLCYYHTANYYADQYSQATLNNTSIPLVTSSAISAPSPQVTIKELYDFMISEMEQSVDALPEKGETMFHATKAAGYGLLARIYLSMSDYTNAQKNAEAALQQNSSLFDWVAYYEADKERFAEPTSAYATKEYNTVCKPMAISNPENYIFRFGNNLDYNGISGKSMGLPMERAARFETGDARLRTHWKRRVYPSTSEELYYGIHGEKMNVGGITSPEMYYIKAECLARKGDQKNITAAMDLLNTVRKKRILPEFYADATASTTKEAVEKIISDKANEYIQTLVPFCDMRRLNKDPEYARTLSKVVNGKTISLKPDSYMWTMPFPVTILLNPGNGSLKQNVAR